jgi:hypothetical protein
MAVRTGPCDSPAVSQRIALFSQIIGQSRAKYSLKSAPAIKAGEKGIDLLRIKAAVAKPSIDDATSQ